MKRLYRMLLRLYPAGFREEYGEELERQFADDYREAAKRWERFGVGLRALADVAATAPGEIAREVWQDLRHATRVYRKRPVATGLALAALALAIGATTGIFSVLNALLIRSLPFREPDRLVELTEWPVGLRSGRNAVQAWREGNQYLEDIAFHSTQPMNLGIGSESLRVTASETTANFLQLLGAEPELGRGFSADEEVPGKNTVAVIGYGLWQQAYGGDPRAIGSTIRLNGMPLTIVGVAPRQFDFPDKTAVWTPSAYWGMPALYHVYQAIGRLKHGVGIHQAAALYLADMDRVAEGQKNRSRAARENSPRLLPLKDRLAGPVRPASLVLMGLMVFVLLIACANLAHLLLSRATERRQELAIRASLGASRARLTRQLITEATVLTAAAAIAGLGVAQWTARLAGMAQPAQLGSREYSVLDWRVLAFALGVAAVTGIVFGVLPASLIGRMQPGQEVIRMQPGVRGSTGMRGVLIALQAALAVTLAAGSFSMGRTFLRLLGVDLGYRTNRVVTLSVSFPENPHGRSAPFARHALERLRAVPGVESAGAAAYLPLLDSKIYEGTFYRFDPSGPRRSTRVMSVSPGYFGTMGTAVIEGREFGERDRAGGEPVIIVNEEFARAFPNQRLVGRRLFLEPARQYATIVGVVRSQRFQGPESEPWDVMFRPLDQYEQLSTTFVASVRGNPEGYLAACRDAVQETDRGVPVYDVKTLDKRLADAVARPRFYTTVIVFLAGFALLLAAVGAYGAASHSVSQRRQEIGIRIAVGGPPGVVRGMVFRQSITPVCAGVAAGLLGAAGLGRLLKHLMSSAEPTGIWLCAAAAMAITAATGIAIWIGTSRVVRTDPTAALRAE